MFFFFPLRDEYRVKKFPLLVLSIIVINVSIFLIQVFNPEYDTFVLRYGFIPSRFSLTTLVTSMFLHSGISHIGFNMWYLWLFGDNIEDRWGRLPFLFFYLSAGIFSMLLYSTLVPEKAAGVPVIGASGAISGILGAYAVLFPKNKITFKYFIWLFLFIVRFGEFHLYAAVWLGLWFVQQTFSTILVANELTASSVAFGAHFAGFLYGLVIGMGTKFYREAKFRANAQLGENLLFNLLGSKPHIIRSIEESVEIQRAKERILSEIENNRMLATKFYGEIVEKYPEVTLPEKIQYAIADSLYRQGEFEKSYIAYKNFVLNYTFSKLADNALLAIGKILMEKKDYQKAKYAFLQIVLFYPYSDVYEEAKYYLEKQLPKLTFKETQGFQEQS